MIPFRETEKEAKPVLYINTGIRILAKNYIKLEAKSLKSNITNAELGFSSKNKEFTRANADFYSTSFVGNPVKLFIPKHNITDKDRIYLSIRASGAESGFFDYEVNETDWITIGRDDAYSQIRDPYDYSENSEYFRIERYVDGKEEENAVMTFSVSGGIAKEEVNATLRFYKKGSTRREEAQIINMTKFRAGKIITFPESEYKPEDSGAYYEIEVVPLAGDEIRVISKSTVPENTKTQNILVPNQEGIIGLLNNKLEKECYNIEPLVSPGQTRIYYISFLVFTGRATYYRINETTGKEQPGTKMDIVEEASFPVTYQQELESHVCIKRPEDGANVVYYIQINDFENPAKENIFESQYMGYFYTRFTPVNTSNFFRYKGFGNYFNSEFNMIMRSIRGTSAMYWIRCKTYPNCNHRNKTELDEKISKGEIIGKEVKGINGYHVHKINKSPEVVKPFSPEQDIILVICADEVENCTFSTMFYTDQDVVFLRDNFPFYQYLHQNDSEHFAIPVNPKAEGFKKVVISITTFNGDINFDLPAYNESYKISNYILAGNKREIELANKAEDDEVLFITLSTKNSFSYYAIEFKQITAQHTEEEEGTMTGVSDIEIIPATIGTSRFFTLDHTKKNDQNDFVVGFESLNCRVDVMRVNDKHPVELTADFYHQDIITREEQVYKEDHFKYNVTLLEMDNSFFTSKDHCMIQISAVELDRDQIFYINETSSLEKDLTVPENYENKFRLTAKFKRIKIIYPHTSKNGPVVLKIIVENEAMVFAKVGFGTDSYADFSFQIGKTKEVFIPYHIIKEKCPDPLEVCPMFIVVNPQDISAVSDGKYINFRISIRSVDVNPTFVRKSQILQDYTVEGDTQYYYTEVNRGEEGEVFVSFNRGSGSVYGRLVRKDINETYPEHNTTELTWLGRYFLPDSPKKNELFTDEFNTRTYYNSSITESRCPEGCYLIIAVDSNTTEVDPNTAKKAMPTTITFNEVNGEPKYTYGLVNEYVAGTIQKNSKGEAMKDKYQFYAFKIEADSDTFILEYYSEVCDVEVFVKGIPFEYKASAKRAVYTIRARDIEETKIKGLTFYLKIYAKEFDSNYIGKYTFRIRTPMVGFTELIQSDSDHMSSCNYVNMKYCYFIVDLKNQNTTDSFFGYANGEGMKEIEMYAKKVSQGEIDSYHKEIYEAALPTETNYNYTSKDNLYGDFIVVEVQNVSEVISDWMYLIVAVKAKSNGIINFGNNFYRYTGVIKPNPTLDQFFFLRGDEYINLAIPKDQFYSVHIVSVFGSMTGKYNSSSEEESYVLQGSEDALSLFMQFKSNFNIAPVYGQDVAFYIHYDVVPTSENYDEIAYGTSTQILLDSEKKDEFPLKFYSRIPDAFNNTPCSFSVNFKQLVPFNRNNSLTTTKGDARPTRSYFQILGTGITETVAVGKKRNKNINPDMSKAERGIFDQTITAGQVHFSVSDFKTINGTKYLYVSVNPTNGSAEYDRIIADVMVLPISTDVDGNAAPHNKYTFGYIENANDIYRYRLKPIDINATTYIVKFGANSDNIAMTVSEIGGDTTKNITGIVEQYVNGKAILTVKTQAKVNRGVQLNVYLKRPGEFKAGLTNFAFSYINLRDGDTYDKYMANKEVRVSESQNKLTFKFDAVKRDGTDLVDTLYFIRFYPKGIKDRFPTINLESIAFHEIPGSRIFNYTPTELDDHLEITVNNIQDNSYYVSVIGVINSISQDYVIYQTIELNKEGGSATRTWVIIMIIVVILLIIALVGVFLYMKKQNDDLLKKVEETSFVGDGKDKLLTGKNQPV